MLQCCQGELRTDGVLSGCVIEGGPGKRAWNLRLSRRKSQRNRNLAAVAEFYRDPETGGNSTKVVVRSRGERLRDRLWLALTTGRTRRPRSITDSNPDRASAVQRLVLW